MPRKTRRSSTLYFYNNVNPPSKAEIEEALKQLKNGKAAGPDCIPPEALKVEPKTTTAMLHLLFLQIWEMEKVPSKWKNGYLVKLPKKGILGSARTGWESCFSQFPVRFSTALSYRGCNMH